MAVKSKSGNLADPVQQVRTWSVPLSEIYNNETLRLDASHYGHESSFALRDLEKGGYPLKPLFELADVKLPGVFKRVWADGPEHGYRYVNGSELINIAGLGAIEKTPRYLSKLTKTKLDRLFLQEGTLLVTCSGTIGRVIYVSKRFKGWVGTHDLIRVVPKSPEMLGYLYTYLTMPEAQAQILGHMHGGQIDHITAQQLMSIRVPVLPKKIIKDIHEQTMIDLEAIDRSTGRLVERKDYFKKQFRSK